MVPAPSGFVLSKRPGVYNGPMDKARVDQLIGGPNAGAVFDQVGGYTETFDSTTGTDTVTVTVWTHGSAGTASRFVQSFATDSRSTATALPGIPGGLVVIAKSAGSDGSYHDAAVAPLGQHSVDVELKTVTAGDVPLLRTLAQDQFRRLSQTTGRT